ncbi:MAG: hypothetical protein WBV45_11510 [Lutimonas sp.]
MNKLFTAIIVLLITQNVFAQEDERNPLLTDRFLIEGGIFIPAKSIKLGADGSTPNEEIDWGETFNFQDNQSTPFFYAEWRFSKKWKLSGEYFGVNNASRVTLDRDIVFEDITFNKGSFVRGGVEFKLFRIFVGRQILSREKHQLGVGLGVHAMNVGAFIEGEILNSEEDLEFRRSRVSALIPLPNIGAWYIWGPHPRWMLGARVDWFGLTVDQYSGGLWNIAPQVKFQIIKNLGIGLDYRFFFLNAKVREQDWNGQFNMDYTGPLFTIHGNF